MSNESIFLEKKVSRYNGAALQSQRTHDAIITLLLLCQNGVASSFWRKNDDIIASGVRWDMRFEPYAPMLNSYNHLKTTGKIFFSLQTNFTFTFYLLLQYSISNAKFHSNAKVITWGWMTKIFSLNHNELNGACWTHGLFMYVLWRLLKDIFMLSNNKICTNKDNCLIILDFSQLPQVNGRHVFSKVERYLFYCLKICQVKFQIYMYAYFVLIVVRFYFALM